MTALRWTRHTDGRGAFVTSEGTVLAEYDWQSANHPYLDRLRPLAHRGMLNNHAPWDHRWHHGLWWSWKFVNDLLFWEDHPGYGGNRQGLGHSTVTRHATADNGGAPRVTQELSWRVDDSGQELLTERRTLTARVLTVGASLTWALDWDLAWTARTDLHLTVTPYPEVPWGGYAGLNFRPVRSMVQQEQILSSEGCGVAEVHSHPAKWAAYTGCVDGAGDDEPRAPATGGLAILQHPDNPRFPEPVYAATATQEFGFLAIAPLLREDLRLASGQGLRLRYRTLALGHVPDRAQLDDAWAEYAVAP